MAKIEEITALLIDEITSFEKSVVTLQNQTEKLDKIELSIDTTLMNQKFIGLMNTITEGYSKQHKQLVVLDNKLKKTIIFPKWMMVLFSSFFILFLFSFSYNFYQNKNTKALEEKAYEFGKSEIKNHLQLYFNDNPKALKDYKKWNKKN